MFLFATRLRLPADMLSFLIVEMSNIETRLTHGASEKLQLSALVGIFHVMRDAIGKGVPVDEVLQVERVAGMIGDDD